MEAFKIGMGVILMGIGWILTASSTLIWIAKAIYDFVKTDLGFFSIVFPNLGLWVLQIVIGVVFITLGKVLTD